MSREPKPIDFPDVNGMMVCTCECAHFQVGLEIDRVGNNVIRVVECVACEAKYAVPYFHDGAADGETDARQGG